MGLSQALCAVLIFALGLVGCGSSHEPLGTAQYYGNYHPVGWIDGTNGQKAHGAQAVAGIDACRRCHEISILKVGSGVPTCLTTGCHHQSSPGFSDPTGHGPRAKMPVAAPTGGGLVSCQICHAKDFTGGASANACRTCHGVSAPHPPKPWRSAGGSAFSHTDTDESNAAVCAECHSSGSLNNPPGHPITPAPAGTQPGCYNATLCHANPVPHPIPFLTGQVDTQGNGHLNATATTFAADCALCHAHAGTSPAVSAPLCNVCHTLANPTTTGTHAGTCLSCHTGAPGLPNGPSGTAFPSLAGAHLKHMALPTALTCDTCHTGSGTGTATHYQNANARTGTPTGPASVSMDLAFKAKTGNPSFTGASLTCSNVSCHGGQTTPGWQVGIINSSNDCLVCHGVSASAGAVTQFNDAFGRHSLGTHDATNPANRIACTTCHNMANGSQGALAHFKYLHTTTVDGVATGTPADQTPSDTIVFDPLIVSGAGTYTVTSSTEGNGGCALTCHTHIHVSTFDTWTSNGAPHPIPFYSGQTDTQGNGHLTATAATFNADCATCHAHSGTTPLVGAPLCVTCHTLGDPTLVATGAGTCLSCHVGSSGLPTGPTGASYPSIEGAHIEHMGLPTTLTCDTCHATVGAGSKIHYDNANARITPPVGPGAVSIDASFHAQSGSAATFSPAALTCSSVSCHGGLVTPNWRTGSIASTSQCTLCHAINGGSSTSQYNDAIGRHAWGTHSTAGALDCTICHDMTLATAGALNHFTELNTTPVSSTNKLPSTTIKFKLSNATYPITGAATYTINATFPEGDGGCALTCHSQVHANATHHWAAEQGTMPHPKPFLTADRTTPLNNPHQTVTLAQFNGECINCHDLTGARTKTGPSCSACHTLGDPTATATGVGTCLSCHIGANFKTLGPQGAINQAWPNQPGAHAKHMALSTFTRGTPVLPTAALQASTCAACHLGSLPGDLTHYSNANKLASVPILSGPASVAMDPTFNAKSGPTGFTANNTAFTCSNVSCHGGQVTPGWQTGVITKNATTYCIACHKVAASPGTQYNDATGRHNSPSEHRVVCSYCHDMTQATPGALNHFKYLDTSVVSGVSGTPPDQYPSNTIKFDTANVFPNGSGPSYTASPQGQGYCTLTCHSGGEQHDSGRKWN